MRFFRLTAAAWLVSCTPSTSASRPDAGDAQMPAQGGDAEVPDHERDASTSAHDAGAKPDASAYDGGSPSSSCSGSTLFCDDFEAHATGTPSGPFSVSTDQGTLVVDATRAYSGSQALHITSAEPAHNNTMTFSEQLSPPLDDLHGRAMFYLTSLPSGPHWDIVYAYGDGNPDVQWEIGGIDEDIYFVVDPPDHALRSGAFPLNQWFCLQWEFKYGGAGQNSFLAKIDGEVLENGEWTGTDPDGHTWAGGPWESLVFGFTKYGEESAQVDIEMWIDDIAFGEQPIDCPTP